MQRDGEYQQQNLSEVFFSLNDQNLDNSASGCQAANVLFWFLMKGDVDDDDYDGEHIDNDGG